jgi:ABC-type phosphate/phosphonate transport system permease subunit
VQHGAALAFAYADDDGLVSYTMLRWETNLRVSTILGQVGRGGLEPAIYNNVQLDFYPRLTILN